MERSERLRQAVDAQFSCACTETEIRYQVISGGGKQYRRQCQTCGKRSQALAVRSIEPRLLALALPVNETLEQEWVRRRRAFWIRMSEQIDAEEREEWFQEHDAYLRSEEWARKRRAVLERDNYQCQGGLRGCSGSASQVHHLSYRHWQNEPLFELTSVCKHCHAQLHDPQAQREAIRLGQEVREARAA